MAEPSKGSYELHVPLDASGIEEPTAERAVKVLIRARDGTTDSDTVPFDAKGMATARFSFREKPGGLRVMVGPSDASDEELAGLQSLSLEVSARRWGKSAQLKLAPIRVHPYYWFWWLRWCRTFVVRGRVLCPDGSPVPGAKVCAYDVDAWWWWCSKQLVGCDTTDVTGAFEIKFRWCCGWWPWWWWRWRVWQLDPFLIEHVIPVLHRPPIVQPIPLPDPVPDLAVFEQVLGEEEIATLNIPPTKFPSPKATSERETVPELQLQRSIDPGVLDRLRDRLLKRLGPAPELARLHIWPWWPWRPWWDCTPDIIFRATQNCEGEQKVVVDEGWCDARWNIPTTLDVTLTANSEACCLADGGDDPEGTCVLLTNVWHRPINQIGGNPGAPAAPVGYLSPGAVSMYGDRPYGRGVLIQGQVGSDVDYYEFEWSADDGATWHDMPAPAVGGVSREFWIPSTDTFQFVPFLTTIDGRLVYESRQHYEATHDPGTWGSTRFWMANHYFSLLRWLTQTPFINGSYRLRVKGWKRVGNHLQNPTILPTCSTTTVDELLLRIDNRLTDAASGHPPSTPDHPCGPGTVHTCTTEPDTDFLAVRIIHDSGPPTDVGACGSVPINATDKLQIDFFAHDPEGHLAYYTLGLSYRESLWVNLLALVDGDPNRLTPLPVAGTPIPPAEQVGPTYQHARSAQPPPYGGAVAPTWRGGVMRLEIMAHLAFPETCCYLLRLRAHKRTIVDGNHGLWNHTNLSEYSFMVTVPVPD